MSARYLALSILLIGAPVHGQVPVDPERDTYDLEAMEQAVETLMGPGALEEPGPEGPAPLAKGDAGAPSTAWKEEPQPWEAEFHAGLGAIINGFQGTHARRSDGTKRRAFHAKSHGGVVARIEVMPGLPEFARQGMFREALSFPAWVRFSNGVGQAQADRKSDVRGLAVKVFGVEGPRALPGETGVTTQDFLATNVPSSGTFPTPREFITFAGLTLENPVTLPFRIIRQLGVRQFARIIKFVAKISRRVRSVAAETYFSGAPIKLGPYAMKFEWRPSAPVQAPRPPSGRPDYLREELAARLGRDDVRFDLVARFFVDEETTPIEGGLVEWTDAAPTIKLAELVIPRQDLGSPGAVAVHALVETLSFNPWHSLEDHRPLGNVMRARRIAYEASPNFRGAVPEPGSFPGVAGDGSTR